MGKGNESCGVAIIMLVCIWDAARLYLRRDVPYHYSHNWFRLFILISVSMLSIPLILAVLIGGIGGIRQLYLEFTENGIQLELCGNLILYMIFLAIGFAYSGLFYVVLYTELKSKNGVGFSQ